MTFPAIFNVDTSLNGTNGFKLVQEIGLTTSLGCSVADAGDFNGDGYADLIVGAPFTDRNNGIAYIIYGSSSTFANPFNVDIGLTGANGFKLISSVAYGSFGNQVASVGDFNGDGIADVVIGAPGAGSDSGAAYIIYGSDTTFANPFNVDIALNGRNGFKLTTSVTGGYFGWSVASAGDFNGDGKIDVAIGADGGDVWSGAAYVVYGNSATFANPFNVDTALNGNNGFKLIASVGSVIGFGRSVASIGDFNGDGMADVVVGAGTTPRAGAAYVIYGSSSTFANPFNVDTALTGPNGFKLTTSVAAADFGHSVASAGDFNGDGMDDVVVGEPGASSSYIVYGSSSAFTNPFNADRQLDGANGFKLIDGATGGHFGWSVASAGDFNGDGKADLIVGAPAAGVAGNTGVAYMVYGSSADFANPFNVDIALNGNNGFKLTTSVASGQLGDAVASAGDFNGDRITDIIVGARGASSAYMIYGENEPWPTCNPAFFTVAINSLAAIDFTPYISGSVNIKLYSLPNYGLLLHGGTFAQIGTVYGENVLQYESTDAVSSIAFYYSAVSSYGESSQCVASVNIRGSQLIDNTQHDVGLLGAVGDKSSGDA